MSDRLLIPRARRLAAPALILPRRLLRYRGRWNGRDDFEGRILVEGRSGARDWIDVQALLDGGWGGQPATALLQVTELIGFGAGASVVPGAQTFTASGSHVVSEYNRLEVAVWGGGAGGGGGVGGPQAATDGTAGNGSSYASTTPVAANGGAPGAKCANDGGTGNGGAGGTASGGDTNTTGDAGDNRGVAGTGRAGKGGDGADLTGTLLGAVPGGAGGASQASGTGNAGSPPGGGGSGGDDGGNNACAGGGGGGGGALKLWAAGDGGAPAKDASITVTVGDTAAGGTGESGFSGGAGARGEVRVQWD